MRYLLKTGEEYTYPWLSISSDPRGLESEKSVTLLEAILASIVEWVAMRLWTSSWVGPAASCQTKEGKERADGL